MWIYERTQGEIALAKMQCPLCNAEATFKIFKQKTKAWYFLIPWFSTKYYATCGNCFNTFGIDKKSAQEVERPTKEPVRAKQQQYGETQRVFLCSNCGSLNAEGYQFCGTCGARLIKPMRHI